MKFQEGSCEVKVLALSLEEVALGSSSVNTHHLGQPSLPHHALSQRRRFDQVLDAFHCKEGVARSPAIKTHSYSHLKKVDIRLPGKGNSKSYEADLLRSSR